MTTIEPVVQGQHLQLEGDLPKDEWLNIGTQLSRLERGVQWAVGDWVNYGIEQYHDGLASATEVLKHLAADTIVKYADVSATFEHDRRRDDLEFTHHKSVMGLARVQQDQLLEEAARLEYTVREIEQRRNEIRSGIKDAASELSGGMTREELQAQRERAKARKMEHASVLYDISRRVKDGATEVRVPREVFFETVLAAFKEPKKTTIDV